MDAKWIEFFTKLGLTTAAQILFLIVIGFFGKQLIQYFFSETIELKKAELNKDIEVYKQVLNTQTEHHRLEMNKILETHRSELNLLGAKNSKLHERQLQIITDLYKRIVIMQRAFSEMTAFMKQVYQDAEKEEQDRIQRATDSYNEYLSFYTENKIFFSQEITIHLDTLREHFFDSHWDYTFNRRTGVTSVGFERYDKAAKIVSEKIPEVLTQLEKTFRNLLTVE